MPKCRGPQECQRCGRECRYPLLVAKAAVTNAVAAVAADPTATPPVAAVAAVPATTVTFTLNKPLSYVGDNRRFWLEIFQSLIPEGPPLQVLVIDPPTAATPAPVAVAVELINGNYLRTDSLRKWVKRNDHGEIPMRAFLGIDPLHVTVFNRMSPSEFVPEPPPVP